MGDQTAGVGDQSAGVQSVGVAVQSAGVGAKSHGVGVSSSSIAAVNNNRTKNSVVMAGPKEKLPKFDGDGMTDPIRHCKTCEMI